jgi:hypothetical protein
MSTAKVRKTLTLDPQLVKALEVDEAGLSATVNAILREEVERRQRREALSDLLARLETERGPVDDERVAEFRRLMQ